MATEEPEVVEVAAEGEEATEATSEDTTLEVADSDDTGAATSTPTFEADTSKQIYSTQETEEEKAATARKIEAEGREGMDKMVYMENNSIRTTIFVLLDEPESGIVARIISLVMMVFILMSSVSLVIETVQSVKDDQGWVDMLHALEVICVILFTIEYLGRVVTCTDRPGDDKRFFGYLLQPLNIIDFASVAPFYIELMMNTEDGGLAVLRMLRMARVFRVMKLGSYASELQLFVKGYNRSMEGLTLLMFMLLMYLCVFGTFLWMAEETEQRLQNGDSAGFTSIPTTWYFIMATMTTVGYGDHYPITWQGKLLCTCTMFVGILVLALPIMIIGNSFEEVFEEEAQFQAEKEHRQRRREQKMAATESTDVEETENPVADNGEDAPSPQAALDEHKELDKKTAIHAAQHLLESLFGETGDTRFKRASQILLE